MKIFSGVPLMTLFEHEELWMNSLLRYLRQQLPAISLITDRYPSEQDLCLYVEKGRYVLFLGAALWH